MLCYKTRQPPHQARRKRRPAVKPRSGKARMTQPRYLVRDGRIFYPYNPHDKLQTDLPLVDAHWGQPEAIPAPILTSPVSASLPIARRWVDVAPKIIEELETAGLKWVAVECFRRHQLGPDTGVDTAFITLSDFPSEPVDTLLEKIHQLTDGLFVELVRGEICLFSNGKPKINIPIPYDTIPPIGAPIGNLRDSGHQGTLGGYVELFKESDPDFPSIQCALTCRHIANPSPGDYLGKLYGSDVPMPFYSVGSDEPPVRIGHPGGDDHAQVIEAQNSYIHTLEQQERELATKNPTDSIIRDLAHTRAKIDQFKQNIVSVSSSNREIGTVLSASGYTIGPNGNVLDWALVQLHPERVGSNQLVAHQNVRLQSARPITSEAPIFKIGRTTNTTFGKVNGVVSFLQFAGTAREKWLVEWAIVTGDGSEIGSYGDSGSLVIERPFSNIIAMLWGGNVANEKADVCYVTPIADIAHHIKAITGYDVRFL